MEYNQEVIPSTVLHWNYRGFTEFPLQLIRGEEADITDIYLKENLISRVPSDIGRLENLVSLYLSGNDITELPREISKLRSLKCLDVSGNRLKCIPDEIGDVRGLKFLILDENELREIPLRIAELSALRYLSVCDNNLRWLPQRPVCNYFHCEIRFWRNPNLKAIPYSLWYHVFREQQTRSLHIGCLNASKEEDSTPNNRCRLKLSTDSYEQSIFVNLPSQHTNIFLNITNTPANLYEMCKRKFYKMLHNAAKYLNCIEDNSYNVNIFFNGVNNNGAGNYENDLMNSNTESLSKINFNVDENGNNASTSPVIPSKENNMNSQRKRFSMKYNYVPSDIIADYYSFLPKIIRTDLCNGPISRCENVYCKEPIFDCVYYEFCLEKIIIIDNTEDIILSATFCSKRCMDLWKKCKTNIIPWTLD